ncbi:MAG: YceI family protein [Bacteroidales bacterium]
MKIIANLSFVLILIFTIGACGSADFGENVEATEAKEVKGKTAKTNLRIVDTENSILEWVGSKPTGEHSGTVYIKSGEFLLQDGKLTGGSFLIDMMSIKNTDIKDPDKSQKIVDHLQSVDFFNTSEFPEAKFEITKIEPLNSDLTGGDWVPNQLITGNLTIKNISKSITFKAYVNYNENRIEAFSEKFTINRAEWDIQYKSKSFFDDLKDNFIHDEIGISIEIKSIKE